jgi:hypothetical protein
MPRTWRYVVGLFVCALSVWLGLRSTATHASGLTIASESSAHFACEDHACGCTDADLCRKSCCCASEVAETPHDAPDATASETNGAEIGTLPLDPAAIVVRAPDARESIVPRRGCNCPHHEPPATGSAPVVVTSEDAESNVPVFQARAPMQLAFELHSRSPSPRPPPPRA